MKRFILLGTLVLPAVASSLVYNKKNGNNMSELVEDNIEALNLDEEEIEGCIIKSGGKCMDWYVEASGGSGVNEHPNYINYMEVLDE